MSGLAYWATSVNPWQNVLTHVTLRGFRWAVPAVAVAGGVARPVEALGDRCDDGDAVDGVVADDPEDDGVCAEDPDDGVDAADDPADDAAGGPADDEADAEDCVTADDAADGAGLEGCVAVEPDPVADAEPADEATELAVSDAATAEPASAEPQPARATQAPAITDRADARRVRFMVSLPLHGGGA